MRSPDRVDGALDRLPLPVLFVDLLDGCYHAALKGESPVSEKPRAKGCIKPSKVSWDQARDFYVRGEIVVSGSSGLIRRKSPSFADVARRFGVTPQAVHYHARRENWKDLREKYKLHEDQLIRERAAEQRACSMGDVLGLVDAVILEFRDRVEKGEAAIRSIAELEKAARVKMTIEEFVQRPSGGDDGPVSLESLQRRYLESQAAEAEETPETAGEMRDAV